MVEWHHLLNGHEFEQSERVKDREASPLENLKLEGRVANMGRRNEKLTGVAMAHLENGLG